MIGALVYRQVKSSALVIFRPIEIRSVVKLQKKIDREEPLLFIKYSCCLIDVRRQPANLLRKICNLPVQTCNEHLGLFSFPLIVWIRGYCGEKESERKNPLQSHYNLNFIRPAAQGHLKAAVRANFSEKQNSPAKGLHAAHHT